MAVGRGASDLSVASKTCQARPTCLWLRPLSQVSRNTSSILVMLSLPCGSATSPGKEGSAHQPASIALAPRCFRAAGSGTPAPGTPTHFSLETFSVAPRVCPCLRPRTIPLPTKSGPRPCPRSRRQPVRRVRGNSQQRRSSALGAWPAEAVNWGRPPSSPSNRTGEFSLERGPKNPL